MIRSAIRVSAGRYLSELIKAELAEYLDHKPYERKRGKSNHRNGFYHRWAQELPSAVKCLERSITQCLTFFQLLQTLAESNFIQKC